MRVDPRRLALFAAVVCAAGGLAFVAHGWLTRPFGRVEAELVFQATRIQRGFPLYVEPAQGAWEMGAPPSRYYVLYTPLWPWLLAKLSPADYLGVRAVGRAVNGLLFLATLGVVVRASRPENRRAVLTGALLAVGLGMLVREAGTADADVAAVALATLGLVRLTHRGGLDGLSAALLAVAPLVKPSVLGTPVGAVAAHVVTQWKSGGRRLLGPLVVGGLAAGALAGVFHAWSHGEWLRHIARATGQTLSFDRWLQEMGGRFMFLGLPHVVAGLYAVRRRAPLVATLPLGTSIAWSAFSMAKHGSGTQYWLEPTMAALVALGACGPAPVASRAGVWLGWAGLVLALAVGGTSFPELLAAAREERRWNAVVEALRSHCTLRPGEVVVSSDSTLELELDGRVIVPSWQTSYLVRNGKFPLDAWRSDLERADGPRWFVHSEDYLEPPPDRVEGITEVSAFRKELRDVMEARFAYDTEIDGMLVYVRR
ncbi:MAG: hypothetical protein ABSE49_13250 [Polyangiaceae bacterium]|jgi:hypothetical protein